MDHGSEVKKDKKNYSNNGKKGKSGRPKNSKNKPKIEDDFSPEDRELESLVQERIKDPESEQSSLRQRSKNLMHALHWARRETWKIYAM